MSDGMTCCPLTSCDEYARVSDVVVRTARKPHVCCECSRLVQRGQKYEYTTMLFDGHWSDYKTCLLCVEIRNHFACEGWVFEQVWSDLEENFFPEMKAGGECMDGLSPVAKQFLIDMRMEWYLGQDEIDDSAWEGWRGPR